MKTFSYFFALMLVVLGFSSELRGQFTPDRFTNRPLTLMNDATSVGWNPALLGMNGETDVVLVIPYDRTWQSTRLVGGFFSSQGIGLGYTSMRNERMPDYSFVPWSFYGGLGIKVPGYNVWTGASFRYSEFGGRTVRYSGSVIYNPYNRLYLSAGISNLNSVNTKDIVYELSTTYTPWDWLSMYGRLRYCADAPLHFEENHSSEFGISAAINRRRIITSFSVNPVAREARFGLEVAFDVFSFGLLNDGSTLNNSAGRFNGGNILLRVNHDNLFAYDHYRYPRPICRTQACGVRGCEGERCGDARCPAFRCIKVDCPGRACTRSTCSGLTCPYGKMGGHIPSKRGGDVIIPGGGPHHIQDGHGGHPHVVGHGDHPPIGGHGDHPINTDDWHNHPVGCPYCKCGIPGHERLMPPSPIYDGGVLNQQDNFMHKEAENPDASIPESTSTGVQKAKPDEAPVTAPKKSEPDDEDSWLDDEESEQSTPKKSMPEETDEDPPFEEAEEPLSDKLASTSISSKDGAATTGKTYKLRKVFFDYDRWEVKEESKEELNVLYSYLDKNPNVCVRLNAHTDSNGTNDYNLNLSQKRAQSVMDFLVDKGIDPIRLSAQGFGEELPVSSNDTHAGREQNRRVEFTQIGC